MIVQASMEGFKRVFEIVRLWFEPWNAAENEQWKELSGDRPFNPYVALQMIRDALRSERALADLSALAELAAALEFYANIDNWTRNRPPGDKVVSIESGGYSISDQGGLPVAMVDHGDFARAAIERHTDLVQWLLGGQSPVSRRDQG